MRLIRNFNSLIKRNRLNKKSKSKSNLLFLRKPFKVFLIVIEETIQDHIEAVVLEKVNDCELNQNKLD